MPTVNNIQHDWYDAWILHAVLFVAKPHEFAPLSRIIGAADMINHAIPTSGELDGALSRLIDGGWVVQSELTFSPSDAAETMYADRRHRRTSIHKDLEFIEKSIGAGRWGEGHSTPVKPDEFVVSGLSESTINEATREYLERAGATSR